MFMGVKRILIPTAQIDVLLKEVEGRRIIKQKKAIEFVQQQEKLSTF